MILCARDLAFDFSKNVLVKVLEKCAGKMFRKKCAEKMFRKKCVVGSKADGGALACWHPHILYYSLYDLLWLS